MYINTLVVKTEKINGLFYENINLLLNRIARPNANTSPSRKFASPSKLVACENIRFSSLGEADVFAGYQTGYPLTTVARGTKSVDIPGYRIIIIQG